MLLIRRHAKISIGSTLCPGLGYANLVLSGSEDASRCRLLLEHLLLLCVGIANLNQVLVTSGLGYWGVVEVLDDLLAGIPSLEPKHN
jgi:hypothetical protein